MSSTHDEPALGQAGSSGDRGGVDFGPAQITRLLREPYGVLCTQGGGQPYGSLLAFASSEDLSQLVFATAVTTRKYALLSECTQVAFLVDDRARQADMMAVSALTAVGQAIELAPGPEREQFGARFLERHPQLEAFLAAPSCALFRVDVVRYFHVTRFQEVHEWRP